MTVQLHILGCLKNAKSLKSQAPQGFSGCLDIENDEMNKKKFLTFLATFFNTSEKNFTTHFVLFTGFSE